MSGRKDRKKLLFDMQNNGAGQAATATVLASKEKSHFQTVTGEDGNDAGVRPDKFVIAVRVEPESGAAFDGEITYEGVGYRQPLEGERVPVRFDPEDPKTIVLDLAKIATDRSEARQRRKERDKATGDGPDPEIIEQLKELQARFDRGEMPEGAFRVERAKILGG